MVRAPPPTLRWAVSQAARREAGAAELEAGYPVTMLGKAARAARKAVRASARAWAACLEKVFEASPVLCVKSLIPAGFPAAFAEKAAQGSEALYRWMEGQAGCEEHPHLPRPRRGARHRSLVRAAGTFAP